MPDTATTRKTSCSNRCPLHLSRRSLLAGAGASALAMEIGLLDFASSLFAAEAKPAKKPLVRAVFLRRNVDRFWMGWPGAGYDIKGHQKQYTKVLTDAAKKLGVDLKVQDGPVHDGNTANAFLADVKKSPPEGIILTIMDMNSWGTMNKIAKERGNIPTVIFSPMGTSFTGHLRATRNIPGVFAGATQDVDWLAFGLRMLNAIWRMKNTRICIVRGGGSADKKLDVIGTTLHYIPGKRFLDELKKVKETDEARAIADYYTKKAKKIVEPTKKDILDAVKNYMVCRRLMAAEKCQGFAMDCLTPIRHRQIVPPCLAFMRLRDEGIVGACEADWPAAISSRLTHLLFERPGFMQDPAPNSVRNTLMGAHCTSGSRLRGFDKEPEPFILRSHSESNIGVAPQVLWPVGEKMTIMKFVGSGKMILGTGKVVANIDTPPSGGCRTSVEVTVDGVADSRDVKGFHQLFILGDLAKMFKAYGQLAGIKVEHI